MVLATSWIIFASSPVICQLFFWVMVSASSLVIGSWFVGLGKQCENNLCVSVDIYDVLTMWNIFVKFHS